MQPGSSIMPGKINPVIPEVVHHVCFKVIANDLAVTLASEAGQLQLNVMEPLIAYCILESQTMFVNAAHILRNIVCKTLRRTTTREKAGVRSADRKCA